MTYSNQPVIVSAPNEEKFVIDNGYPYWIDCTQVAIDKNVKVKTRRFIGQRFDPEGDCENSYEDSKTNEEVIEGLADCNINMKFLLQTNEDNGITNQGQTKSFTIYSEDTTATLINEIDGSSLSNITKFEEKKTIQSVGYYRDGDWPSTGYDGSTCVIYPFRLPNFGNEAAPFTDVRLKIYLKDSTDDSCDFPILSLDGLDVRDTSEVSVNDFRFSSLYAEQGTLLQSNMVYNGIGLGVITSDDISSYLNSQYANGLNANKYVFLRLYVSNVSELELKHKSLAYTFSSICDTKNKRPKLVYDYTIHGRKKLDDCYGFLFDSWQDYEGEKGNGTGSNFFALTIGDNIYNKCYLQGYSINIKPFMPIDVQASFKCYSPPSDEKIKSFSSDSSFYQSGLESKNFIYSQDCSFKNINGEVLDNNMALAINYTKNYVGVPIFTIDSAYPTKYFVDECNSELKIDSTGFKVFIPNEGKQTTSDIEVFLKNHEGLSIGLDSPKYYCKNEKNLNGLSIKMSSGSLLRQQNVNINGGDSIYTKTTIKDTLL